MRTVVVFWTRPLRPCLPANKMKTLPCDQANGKVVGELDMTSLIFDARQKNPNIDALNGIAYDSIMDKIYATGKLWPNIYEINFSH